LDNVGAEQTSSGRLFQAIETATQNARLLSCSLVLVTNKSHGQRKAKRKG